MALELGTVLADLARRRPVFHSERDFQHALAWEIQLRRPGIQVRLEPRPRRGVHLDLLVLDRRCRIAIEVKYLLAGFRGVVEGENFDLPNQAAQDISRYDVVKDLVRVESLLADGYADAGHVLVLSNDATYWRPSLRADTVDAAFRIHEGRVLTGSLAWAAHTGQGTTKGRETPLALAGHYTCSWTAYSTAVATTGRTSEFRYLLLPVPGTAMHSLPCTALAGEADAPTPTARAIPAPRTARDEILAVAQRLAAGSSDGSFTLMQILIEMRRTGSRYAESTIRTHVTSRMCTNAPNHHATTFDDLERVGEGRYRLRTRPAY